MDDLVAVIAIVVALVLFGLALAIIGERVRQGMQRAEMEKMGRRNSEHELTMRLDQVERAIAEQKPAIAAAERQLEGLKAENAALKAKLDASEHLFAYTAVPLDSRDMHARTWRFSARHGNLGADLPETEPAGTWNGGRPYAIAAANQAEARSVIDRLLPRHRGFVVVNVGEALADLPPA